MKPLALALALSFAVPAVAQGEPLHHRKARAHRFVPVDASGNEAIVTVPTAAGIKIKVASDFAGKIQGFIADLVARGYKPKHIGCYSWAKSHVRHSLHHSGEACDFDQHGWGKTARPMYHVRALAQKWGLRDGCTFRDCGHIDAGRSETALSAHRHKL